MAKVVLNVISDGNYREWYKRERAALYNKYGKAVLAIDRQTHNVVRIFSTSDVKESLSFCAEHHLVHQLCDKVFYGETEIVPVIR